MSEWTETETYSIGLKCKKCKTEGELKKHIYHGRLLKKSYTIVGPFEPKGKKSVVCSNCSMVVEKLR